MSGYDHLANTQKLVFTLHLVIALLSAATDHTGVDWIVLD
jgi:hypothetical protein